MTTINRSRHHDPAMAEARRRDAREDHSSERRLRPQLLADGVIAGYIHDISPRHRNGQSDGEGYEPSLEREAA